MHKSFSFKGINRSTDLLLGQDGECLDVVNLRMSNGSLHPMPKPVEIAGLQGKYSAVYTHGITDCHVAITADEKQTLHFFDSDWKRMPVAGGVLEFENLRDVIRVEFLGNIVCCLSTRGVYYLLFEDYSYRLLGERPAIPDMTITVTSKLDSIVTENCYNSITDTDDLENTWSYNEKGYIDEAVYTLNKSGYYIDRALFIVALRLYDGSYINCSNVIYVSDEENGNGVGRDAYNLISESLTTDLSPRYKVYARGFKADFSFDTTALADWRNVVVGIDLFSTTSIMGKKCSLEGRTVKFERYSAKTLDELWNEIASAALYYKVAEFDIDGKLLHCVDDVSAANLALQEGYDSSLTASLSRIVARASCVYNGRLHIGALREYFFLGYDAHAFKPLGNSVPVDSLVVHTKICTVNGDFIVEKTHIRPKLGHDGYSYELSPLLSYPDSRASEMTLYIVAEGIIYRKVFPLHPHNYLNLAFYLHKWYSPYTVSQESQFASGGSAVAAPAKDVLKIFGYEPGVYKVVYSSSMQSWVYDGKSFPPEEYKSLRAFAVPRNVKDGDAMLFTIERRTDDFSFKDIYNIPVDSTWDIVDSIPEIEEYSLEERPNVMKVSMVDNPFVFPASCTYAPSQGSIVGVSGNTSTISQGQFGQFPLYVFCSDGIWAMQVDTSGSMAYLSCHQVTRDICVNAKSICGIADGVVFVANQGVMLIYGNNVKNFSASLQDNTTSLTGVPRELFTDIASLVSLTGNVGEDDFRGYISTATVTCLHSHNELLISNADYDYSYVCSFDSGIWSRVSERFTGKVLGGSDVMLFARDADMTMVYAISDNVSGDNRVLLYTRPLLWGTKLPKRIMQLLLHVYAEPIVQPTNGLPVLACYMLCSNDGIHFKLIAGSEKNAVCRDVQFPYFPTQSYKYYVFAIVGELGEHSTITGMELDVAPAWNNKLR